jgi:uncharacterized membrane protein
LPAGWNHDGMNNPSSRVAADAASAARGWKQYLTILAWCAILAGCVLRFSQLSTRDVFVDEAITQIRVAGHTDAEMNATLYDGRQRTTAVLQSYAQVGAGSTAGKTVASLAKEDTQHPPLFYVAELAIVHAFGNALVVWRLLPALCGVLSIAAAYALARELFSDRRVQVLAAALTAVSPIQRIYSEQAREYSLLALLVLLATFAVVRATRTNTIGWWMLYAVLVTAGLYASPFMVYVVPAHCLFVAGVARRNLWPTLIRFAGSAAVAFAAYIPWLYELAIHRGDIVASNVWSATRWPVSRLAAKWIFNTGSTFFDLEYINLRWGIVLALVAVFAAIAIWRGFREADAQARWCLGAAIVIPAILLVAPDLFFGEHRSAVARYGLPVFVMIPIIAARGLVGRPISATIILAAGLCASAVGSTHASWWDNDSNADDFQIAAAINKEPHAQVASTIAPPEFIPLARLLRSDVLVSLSPDLSTARFSAEDPLFLLRPNSSDLAAVQKRSGFRFVPVPFARIMTAHEMGAHLADAGGDEGDAGDLYRAVRSGS